MQGLRKDRVSEQLQREIAAIVQFEMKDPGLGFVTITKVDLSNDLSHAKVGFSCLGEQPGRASTQEALDRAAGYIRSLVKKRLRLKIIPEIVFRYDETVEQAIAMSAKLDELGAAPLPKPVADSVVDETEDDDASV